MALVKFETREARLKREIMNAADKYSSRVRFGESNFKIFERDTEKAIKRFQGAK